MLPNNPGTIKIFELRQSMQSWIEDTTDAFNICYRQNTLNATERNRRRSEYLSDMIQKLNEFREDLKNL